MPDPALPQRRESLLGDVETLTAQQVTRCAVSFGAYTDALGAVAYAGLTGKVRPSVRVTSLTGDVVVVREWVTFTLDAGGAATVSLPHTDQTGITPTGFTYEVSWDRRLGDGSPGDKVFALPVAAGSTVDFDLLSVSANLPGVLVPVIDPTVDPRLDALEAAVATKASTGAMNGADAALSARLTTVETALPTKAATTYVDAADQALSTTLATKAATTYVDAADSALATRATALEARHRLVVSPTNPHLAAPGLWVQTGLAGGGFTIWIEDGT